MKVEILSGLLRVLPAQRGILPGLVYQEQQLPHLKQKMGFPKGSPFVFLRDIYYPDFVAISSSIAVVRDFGRSIGWPSALAQIVFAETPRIRLIPKITV